METGATFGALDEEQYFNHSSGIAFKFRYLFTAKIELVARNFKERE
jgi:hypothetical protein